MPNWFPGGAAGGLLLEAGGDDGDLHFVLHLLVKHRAEDDVGVFVRGALNDGGSLVDLGQLQRS